MEIRGNAGDFTESDSYSDEKDRKIMEMTLKDLTPRQWAFTVGLSCAY